MRDPTEHSTANNVFYFYQDATVWKVMVDISEVTVFFKHESIISKSMQICILEHIQYIYKEGGLTINFNKTEFIAINTDQEFHINIEEIVTIKQVQNFKYLGVNLNKKGIK